MAEPFLIVTTEAIAGHRIVRTVGLVFSALSELEASARAMGANAVVGARLLSSPTGFHTDAYGTAVVVEPADG